MKSAILLKDHNNNYSYIEFPMSILMTDVQPIDSNSYQNAIIRLLKEKYLFMLDFDRLKEPIIHDNTYIFIYPLKKEERDGFDESKPIKFTTFSDLMKKFKDVNSEDGIIINKLIRDKIIIDNKKVIPNSLTEFAPEMFGGNNLADYHEKYLKYKIKYLESQKKILDLEEKIKSFNI